MYRNAILYKGVYLAPNSEAIELYHNKQFDKLDKLMKKVDADKRKIEGIK